MKIEVMNVMIDTCSIKTKTAFYLKKLLQITGFKKQELDLILYSVPKL